jgi:hypothetical protein
MKKPKDEPLPSMMLSGSVQLHPESCASSIRWSVRATRTHSRYEIKGVRKETYGRDFEANVYLTDCSRQIGWSSASYDNGASVMIEKLDVAIAELRAAKAAVRAVANFYDHLQVTKDDDDEA